MSVATKDAITNWLKTAQKDNKTHVIVVCDTFDHNDYPVFVGPEDDIAKLIETYSENMQRIMEIYKVSMDWDQQLSKMAYRSNWNL
jgi:hypothetical protein